MHARAPRPVMLAVLVAAVLGAGAGGIAILTGDGTEPRSSASAIAEPAAEAPAATTEAATTEAATTEAATTEATTTEAATTDAATTEAATTEAAITEALSTPDTAAVPMPMVVRLRLDVAKAALDRVGIPYAVDGGGLFGVFDDAAWTVCATDPEPGTSVEPGVTAVLRIDRECA